jgi:hypothetical protein
MDKWLPNHKSIKFKDYTLIYNDKAKNIFILWHNKVGDDVKISEARTAIRTKIYPLKLNDSEIAKYKCNAIIPMDIIELYNKGYSTSEIANICNIADARSVRYYLKRAGIILGRGPKYNLYEMQFRQDGSELGIRLLNENRTSNRLKVIKPSYCLCYNCKDIINKSDGFEVDDKLYCEECYNELFIVCNNCEEIVDRSNAHYIESEGIQLCDSCFSQDYFTCNRCNYTENINNGYTAPDDELYCEDCYQEHCSTCENCGEGFWIDDLQYNEEEGCYYCDSCYEENSTIKNYSYKPEPIFAKEKYENTLYMGLELEVETEKNSPNEIAEALLNNNEKNNIADRFYFKHDGSLHNGFEIVSHPSTLKYYKRYKMNNMLKWLSKEGCTSHDKGTCGLHIHLDRKFFNNREEQKLALFFSNNISQIVKISRRGNKTSACEPEMNYSIKEYKINRHPSLNQEGRYKALNFKLYKTIEIRIFRGTLKHSSFLATLQFCEAICYFIKEASAFSMNWKAFKEWLRQKNRYNHLEKYLTQKGV